MKEENSDTITHLIIHFSLLIALVWVVTQLHNFRVQHYDAIIKLCGAKVFVVLMVPMYRLGTQPEYLSGF